MLEDMKLEQTLLPCIVRTIIESLDDNDRHILSEALDNSSWGDLPLSKALTKRGLRVSNFSIKKHRDKECSCRLINA